MELRLAKAAVRLCTVAVALTTGIDKGIIAMDRESSFANTQPHPSCSKYERILMTRLRDKMSNKEKFSIAANRLAELLAHRVIEYLPTVPIAIETPVAPFIGEELATTVELVSIMRSGDALLETFSTHFPDAAISKILVQRDEETSLPHFQYMKLSPTLPQSDRVIITEPMIATGGTLTMAIKLLKEQGVSEENIIIAAVCAAPEGLTRLQGQFPAIKVVTIVIDEKLNENNYIVPGIGDFGNRYFGT